MPSAVNQVLSIGLIFLCSLVVHQSICQPSLAEAHLKIENRVGKEKIRINIGEELIYKTKAEDFYRSEYIRELHGDGQLIVTDHNIVSTYDIDRLRFVSRGDNFWTTVLKAGGSQLFLAGVVSLFYDPKVWEAIPIGAGATGLGFWLATRKRIKTKRLDRGLFLKVVDNPYLNATN